MPYSTNLYKQEIKNHLLQTLPIDAKILDVGAGAGTYSDLLDKKFNNMDAIEIYEPYIERFNLKEKYRNVFVTNVNDDLHLIHDYDYIILGDVVEHMGIGEAGYLLSFINNRNKKMLVGVPYKYEQGEWEGNIYETHHQPDLTLDLFLQRYPYMFHFLGNQDYGYFVNYKI